VKLATAFRLSLYLCLALAILCLGYSERGSMPPFYLCVVLLILVAFVTEERWAMPSAAANLLAVAILLGWLIWFMISLRRMGTGDDALLNLLRALLPSVGPLMSLLLLAKLFRPKQPSDYWLLHGLGLVQVVLACVLALGSRLDREDVGFPLLLLGYVLTGLWSLVMFYLHREDRLSAQTGPPPAVPAGGRGGAAAARVPWLALGLRQSVAWFALAGVLALVFFFVVPRPVRDASASFWVPGRLAAQTGFSPGLDLNAEGPIEVSNELVMHVEARDRWGAPVQLDPDQRWRGVTCAHYDNGQWQPLFARGMPGIDTQFIFDGDPAPGYLGPGQVRLTFFLDTTKVSSGRAFDNFVGDVDALGGQPQPLFLAEPVTLNARGLPLVWLQEARSAAGRRPRTPPLRYRRLETALLAAVNSRFSNLVYDQVCTLPEAGEALWGESIDLTADRSPTGFRGAAELYARGLLQLPDRVQASGRIAAKAHAILGLAWVPTTASPELKARVLEQYLIHSGEYGYTLFRHRDDPRSDPTEDFLCNTRQGHCQLFASALALMLRSEGIPARVVVGFRGYEWNSSADFHEVRQYHAHAWVEALIEEPEGALCRWIDRSLGRPPSNAVGIVRRGRWLTLDPTPAGGTAGAISADLRRGEWDDQLELFRHLWEFFILDYSGDLQRERLLAKLSAIEWLPSTGGFLRGLIILTALTALALAVSLLLRWRRRRRVLARHVIRGEPFYARLVRLLERLPLRPHPAQTPDEFSAQATHALRHRLAGQPADLTDVPQRVVAVFYRVRFGGQHLDPAEAAALDRDLTRLAQALA
jgi:hypothetical protein